jgi:hypothetical protein
LHYYNIKNPTLIIFCLSSFVANIFKGVVLQKFHFIKNFITLKSLKIFFAKA